MKKVLVLAASYPNLNGDVSLMYIHTRNVAYIKENLEVTVLNFKAKENYTIDNINVITLDEYKKSSKNYDILILHAANLRNHYKFLKHYGKKFPRFIFFYHGHEVLKINKVYSKPYPYVRKSKIKAFLQDCYDVFKLYIWRKYLPKVINKSDFIFVSNWMYKEFLINTKIKESLIKEKVHITYNSVGLEFENNIYNDKKVKEYDFITIRSNLDGSKYSIDIINRLAKNSKDMKFLIVGKGEFFNHYEKAENITWLNKTMGHDEILEFLNKARFALMPTRTDAQGLMMCEMAAFGIPLITSDIEVCHEVFDNFKNVYFIDNNNENENLNKFKLIDSVSLKDTQYFLVNTIKKEIAVINKC